MINEKAFKQLTEAIDAKMDDIVDYIFAKSQEELVSEGKIDTGNLLRSGNVERKFLFKKIIYTAPYAAEVHDGRPAGTMPDVNNIMGWARRKLGLRMPELKSASWAIAISIKNRGIQPFPFLDRAVNQGIAKFGKF